MILKSCILTLVGGLLLNIPSGSAKRDRLIFPAGIPSLAGQTEIAQPAERSIADVQHYLDPIKAELDKVWPKNRTLNLVFHGHSVVAGYQDQHEVHTFESYPYQLLRKLKRKYPYAVINVMVTAIGGENAEQGAQRFNSDVMPHQPDVLFIDYALNDLGIGLKRSKAAWEVMIKQALKQHIKVILVTPSPDKRINLLAPDNPLALHARQIQALASKYHIGLADPFSIFQRLAKDEGGIDPYMSHVNHPNKWGNALIAEELMKWF